MSLAAAGLVVGLPWGQPGNSEVGHAAIGTGRIIIQDLAHINHDIRTGDFFKNEAFLKAAEHVKEHGSALHLMGNTSPGGIHSHTDHLIALLAFAKQQKLPKVFIHFIADGQDMPPQDAVNVLKTLEKPIKKSGAKIASLNGRSFAMDRVVNGKLTDQVWHSVVLGDAPRIDDAEAYLKASYEKGMTDYSIEPATVFENEKPVGSVQDNDAFIFFDFRNDRVRQLATPFIQGEHFESFDRVRVPKNLHVVTMTKYAEEFSVPVAYPPVELNKTLGHIISERGWRQYRISEKEKEAHVTNFFNGGRITPLEHEERIIVSSRQMKGKEYIEHPEMSAQKIVDTILEKKDEDAHLFVVNFANPDMIGHAGNLEATKKAVQVIDTALKQTIEAVVADPDTAVIITADHGNAEELIDPLTGEEDTQHSARNVPVIIVAQRFMGKGKNSDLEQLAQQAPIGALVDIAPTVLDLLGLSKPTEMTGSSLLKI
jgi:2,3-bisphosphoglycerate-independent phosphoglycerate mutase